MINLSSSSLKQALVDSTGAFIWDEGQDQNTRPAASEGMQQDLGWWGDFSVSDTSNEEGMMLSYAGATAPLTTPLMHSWISCDRVSRESDATDG